jgi:uncharacterized protein (TIGR02246 family)
MTATLEDRDEILQLLYRYNHAIDGGDASGWADLFTKDGVFDVGGEPMVGRDALVEFAANVHGLRHVVVNPLIELEGDSATVRAYLFVLHGSAIAVTGSYLDEVVRTADGWRFAKRSFTPDAAG